MEWIFAHWDQIASIVVLVVGWLLARPWAKTKIAEAEAMAQRTNLILAWRFAVSVAQRVYQDVVRPLKENGKWDADAKRAALMSATNILKAELKEHGIELAQAILPGLIQMAVQALKSGGVAVPSPFSPVASPASASVPPPELGPSIPGLP